VADHGRGQGKRFDKAARRISISATIGQAVADACDNSGDGRAAQ
jgi:hypothetical protein